MTFILLAIEDSRLWEQSMSAFAWCRENLMGRIDKLNEIAQSDKLIIDINRVFLLYQCTMLS